MMSSENGRAFTVNSGAERWRVVGGHHGRPEPERRGPTRPSNDRQHRGSRPSSIARQGIAKAMSREGGSGR